MMWCLEEVPYYCLKFGSLHAKEGWYTRGDYVYFSQTFHTNHERDSDWWRKIFRGQ
jgi:hypothetical protein